MNLPAGYQPHPQDPTYAWNPATGEVRTVASFTTAAAPPAGGAPTWGEQDMAAAEEARQGASQFDGDKVLWLEFPEGRGEVSMMMRFFPPIPGETSAFLVASRHRLPARLVPGCPPGREAWYLDCPNSPGGPGNCPVCRVLGELPKTDAANTFSSAAKAKKQALWQGVDIANPAQHTRNGIVVPGVLRASPTLHSAILGCFRLGLNFTSPTVGFPVEVIKKPGQHPAKGAMNIEYDACPHQHLAGPISPELWPALHKIIDLKTCVRYDDAAKLEQIAQNILREFGGSPSYAQPPPPPAAPGGFIPHPTAPGYLYNPATGQVMAAPPPAPPPYVPPALPAPPAAPPPAPGYGAHPGYPPAAPPAAPGYGAPPGYPPAAPPAAPGYGAPPGYPPAAPPPAPGYGAHPGHAAPPPPPAAPAAPPPPPLGAALPPAAAPGLSPGAPPPAPPPPPAGAMPPGYFEAQMGAVPGAPPPPPPPPPAGEPGVMYDEHGNRIPF